MKKSITFICILICYLPFLSIGQTAESLIQRYIEVTGGEQKLRAIKKIETQKFGSTFNGDIEIVDEFEIIIPMEKKRITSSSTAFRGLSSKMVFKHK